MKSDNRIIIVTGSSGRIGDAVMRRMAGRSYDVVGFDREAPSPPPPNCTSLPVEAPSEKLNDLRMRHEAARAWGPCQPGHARLQQPARGRARVGTLLEDPNNG